jgi:hypothetical protein
MPTTGMPDRGEPPQVPLITKHGVSSTKPIAFNPGKPAGGK